MTLTVIPNWLSIDECKEACLSLHQGRPDRARVSQPNSPTIVDDQVRVSEKFSIPETIVSVIRDRLHLLPRSICNLAVELNYSGFQILRYRSGGFFIKHIDTTNNPEAPSYVRRRVLTVVCALNSPYSFGGGDLVLYPHNLGIRTSSVPHRLPTGTALCFPAGTVHEVKLITWGERVSLVGWGMV